MTASSPELGSVVVIGPNLRTPDHARFHIHRTGCTDIRRYGHGPLGGEISPPERFATFQDLVESWYQDIIAEQETPTTWEAYADEFRVFPCADQPVTTPKTRKTTMTTNPVPASKFTPCACGCGATTNRLFAAGHDNRLYGQVRRGEKPESALDPYPGLVRKLDRAKWADERKADRKAESAALEAVAKPSDDLLAGMSQVKIGRWTYDLVEAEAVDDNLVRVTYLAKGVEKTLLVPPKALS